MISAVRSDAHKARLSRAVEHLCVLALSAAHHGRHNLYLGSDGIGHDLVDDLVDGLLAYLPSADGAVRHAYAGVKQTQVVVYLCDCADR